MPSLLAYTLVAKYCDHLPLYRQAAMWQREGFDINRSTLSSWVIRLDKVCSPLIPYLQECILNGLYCQADESPIQVLNEKDRKNTQKSYMWAHYRTPPCKALWLLSSGGLNKARSSMQKTAIVAPKLNSFLAKYSKPILKMLFAG